MRYWMQKAARLVLCALLFAVFFAGRWSDLVRSVPERAEEAYKRKDYQQALELYQEAQTRDPDSDTLAYNLANTMYKLGRYEEAQNLYGRILQNKNPALGPRSYYNMGNTLYRMGSQTEDQQSYQQALEAYRQSIGLDPEDRDAKYNYELVRRLLKEQQQQQQQQNQDKQDQDKKQQQQQQQQQQNQQQQQQQQDKQQQQDRQQDQQQAREEQQQPRPKPGQMSKEEAERILKALIQMEKSQQQKDKEKKAPAERRGPDW